MYLKVTGPKAEQAIARMRPLYISYNSDKTSSRKFIYFFGINPLRLKIIAKTIIKAILTLYLHSCCQF